MDFCLGKKSCKIPYNLRKLVSWFGVKLKVSEEVIFIARQSPFYAKNKNARDAYFSNGISPEKAPAESNSSVDDLMDVICSKFGLNTTRFIPKKSQSRAEFKISIRHALNYAFQAQGVISDKEALFPAVKDGFKKNDLKNTLPYFLGAISEDKLDLIKEKELISKKLRQKTKIFEENKRIAGEGFSKGVSLITECKSVGLISESMQIPGEMNEICNVLKKAQAIKPSFNYENNLAGKISNLFNRNDEINNKLREIKLELEAINFRLNEFKSFNEEKYFQQLRLKSVNLFSDTISNQTCPLCKNDISCQVPKVEEIKEAYNNITENLQSTTTSFPKLKQYVSELEKKEQELTDELKINKESIVALKNQEEKFHELKELEDKYLLTVGRISLWIESFEVLNDNDILLKEIERLEAKLNKIEQLLDENREKEKFSSILNNINYNMTEQNKNLATNIEHKLDTISYDPI